MITKIDGIWYDGETASDGKYYRIPMANKIKCPKCDNVMLVNRKSSNLTAPDWYGHRNLRCEKCGTVMMLTTDNIFDHPQTMVRLVENVDDMIGKATPETLNAELHDILHNIIEHDML